MSKVDRYTTEEFFFKVLTFGLRDCPVFRSSARTSIDRYIRVAL